ncbi:MAG TPA: hypothetical protein VK498_09270 [Ferruginibacter sp.]|nr:hypothetical protein [Ferruginibacter sp.]
MKNRIILLSVLFTLLSGAAIAQDDRIRQVPCSNESIMHQADSIKKLLISDGFVILKEASMTMESEYEMPVIVPLTEGTWYQFVFIGEISSKLYEVRMFDWNEKQVVYQKKMWGDVDGNVISYSYIPKFTEYHMIRPVQVNKKKKKGLCGYVMLLKRVRNSVKPAG